MDTTEIYSAYGSMMKEAATIDKSDEIAQEEYDDLILPYQEALAILNVRLTALREEYKSQSRNYPHTISNPLNSVAVRKMRSSRNRRWQSCTLRRSVAVRKMRSSRNTYKES